MQGRKNIGTKEIKSLDKGKSLENGTYSALPRNYSRNMA